MYGHLTFFLKKECPWFVILIKDLSQLLSSNILSQGKNAAR